MANKQINIRLPRKLLNESHDIVKDHNFKNLQHLIVEGLRKIILEHKIKKEVEAIKQFQEFHGMQNTETTTTVKDMARKYGLQKFK